MGVVLTFSKKKQNENPVIVYVDHMGERLELKVYTEFNNIKLRLHGPESFDIKRSDYKGSSASGTKHGSPSIIDVRNGNTIIRKPVNT